MALAGIKPTVVPGRCSIGAGFKVLEPPVYIVITQGNFNTTATLTGSQGCVTSSKGPHLTRADIFSNFYATKPYIQGGIREPWTLHDVLQPLLLWVVSGHRCSNNPDSSICSIFLCLLEKFHAHRTQARARGIHTRAAVPATRRLASRRLWPSLDHRGKFDPALLGT